MDIVLMLLVIVTFQAIRVFVRTRGKGFLRFGMIGLTLESDNHQQHQHDIHRRPNHGDSMRPHGRISTVRNARAY
jgi:hypothetical protein